MPQRVLIEQFKISGKEASLSPNPEGPVQKLLDAGSTIVNSSSAAVHNTLSGTSFLYVTFVLEVPTTSM